MSQSLYLSRARLRVARGEALSAIAPILMPDDDSHRAGRAHRLVWLLFQYRQDAARDFLWRDEGDSKFMILSPCPPTDPHGLFDLETKPFAPELAVGDELRFALRANPVVARKGALSADDHALRLRGKRVDVVMDALHAVPNDERNSKRDAITADAGLRWTQQQGARAGFTPNSVVVASYGRVDIADQERKKRRDRAGIAVMDIEGVLTVTDPAAFVAKLGRGFGGAKGFGNGLMMIKRI